MEKKLVIGEEARCEKELKELITSKFNDITKENCDGFYKKMLGFIYTGCP